MSDNPMNHELIRAQKAVRGQMDPSMNIVPQMMQPNPRPIIFGGTGSGNLQPMRFPAPQQFQQGQFQGQIHPNWNQAPTIHGRSYPTTANYNEFGVGPASSAVPRLRPRAPPPSVPMPQQFHGQMRPSVSLHATQLQHHLMQHNADQARIVRQQRISMSNNQVPMLNRSSNMMLQTRMPLNQNPVMPVQNNIRPVMKTGIPGMINMENGAPATDNTKYQHINNGPIMNPGIRNRTFPVNYRNVVPVQNHTPVINPRTGQQPIFAPRARMITQMRTPRPPPNRVVGLSGVPVRMQAPVNIQSHQINQHVNMQNQHILNSQNRQIVNTQNQHHIVNSQNQAIPGPSNNLPSPDISPSIRTSEQRNQLRNHLIMLLHSQSCLKRDRHSNNNIRCSYPKCDLMKSILCHLSMCSVVENCEEQPFCSSSKMILKHWINCDHGNCLLCRPIEEARENQSRNQSNPQMNPQSGPPQNQPAPEVIPSHQNISPENCRPSTSRMVPMITNNTQRNFIPNNSIESSSPNERPQSFPNESAEIFPNEPENAISLNSIPSRREFQSTSRADVIPDFVQPINNVADVSSSSSRSNANHPMYSADRNENRIDEESSDELEDVQLPSASMTVEKSEEDKINELVNEIQRLFTAEEILIILCLIDEFILNCSSENLTEEEVGSATSQTNVPDDGSPMGNNPYGIDSMNKRAREARNTGSHLNYPPKKRHVSRKENSQHQDCSLSRPSTSKDSSPNDYLHSQNFATTRNNQEAQSSSIQNLSPPGQHNSPPENIHMNNFQTTMNDSQLQRPSSSRKYSPRQEYFPIPIAPPIPNNTNLQNSGAIPKYSPPYNNPSPSPRREYIPIPIAPPIPNNTNLQNSAAVPNYSPLHNNPSPQIYPQNPNTLSIRNNSATAQKYSPPYNNPSPSPRREYIPIPIAPPIPNNTHLQNSGAIPKYSPPYNNPSPQNYPQNPNTLSTRNNSPPNSGAIPKYSPPYNNPSPSPRREYIPIPIAPPIPNNTNLQNSGAIPKYSPPNNNPSPRIYPQNSNTFSTQTNSPNNSSTAPKYSPLHNNPSPQIYPQNPITLSIRNNSPQNSATTQNNSSPNFVTAQIHSPPNNNSSPRIYSQNSNPSPIHNNSQPDFDMIQMYLSPQNDTSLHFFSQNSNFSPIETNQQHISPASNSSSPQEYYSNPSPNQNNTIPQNSAAVQKYSPIHEYNSTHNCSPLQNSPSNANHSLQNYSPSNDFSPIPSSSPIDNHTPITNVQNYSPNSNPSPTQNQILQEHSNLQNSQDQSKSIENNSSALNSSPHGNLQLNQDHHRNHLLLETNMNYEDSEIVSEANVSYDGSDILSMLQEQENRPNQSLLVTTPNSSNTPENKNLEETVVNIPSNEETQNLSPQSFASISPSENVPVHRNLLSVNNNHGQSGNLVNSFQNSSFTSEVAAIIERLPCGNSPSPPTNHNNKRELEEESTAFRSNGVKMPKIDYYGNSHLNNENNINKIEEIIEIKEDSIDNDDSKEIPKIKDEKKVSESLEIVDLEVENNSRPSTPEELKEALLPILEILWGSQHDHNPFRCPVDPQSPGCQDYDKIIKNPMDLSKIKEKLDKGMYSEPWEFIEDIQLMFNNAWEYNKKHHWVYKYCNKLAEIFSQNIDPAMRKLGYCCGQKFKFDPKTLCCYGKELCVIPKGAKYYYFEKSQITFCEDCFKGIPGETVTLKDNKPEDQNMIKKKDFLLKVNDVFEPEQLVTCTKCYRKEHEICVLHSQLIRKEGFICKRCLDNGKGIRKRNVFTAKYLQETKLSSYIEKRVNNFLRLRISGPCDVIIRVVSSSHKKAEIKPAMRSKFVANGEIPGEFPYQSKTIFAFKEIDGDEVCFFGMHVQEYGSESESPNARRVYIAYLDSVNFFKPKEYRTSVYHEILLGYLDYAKQLGYTMAHIWACPPYEGDDYIFPCHPQNQKVPKLKRLQRWYKAMLDKGMTEKIIFEYKDILKQALDDRVSTVCNFPYFEGDYWPNCLEDIITQSDGQKIIASSSTTNDGAGKSSANDEIEPKRLQKMKGSQRKTAKSRFIPPTGNDLLDKTLAEMEKHRENFFVVRLHSMRNAAYLGPIQDPDPLIDCELMDGRDAFLTMARERNYEFSSLRRAKFATMMMLYELHNQSQDKFVYVCDNCKCHMETGFHCTVCHDYDLCIKCADLLKHPHKMDRIGLDLDDVSSNSNNKQLDPQEQRRLTISVCIKSLIHGKQCRDANCRYPKCAIMKKKIEHAANCKYRYKDVQKCITCKQLFAICFYHFKRCTEQNCNVPYCAKLKFKRNQQQLQQRLQQAQLLRRRMAVLNSKQTQQVNNNMLNTQQSYQEVNLGAVLQTQIPTKILSTKSARQDSNEQAVMIKQQVINSSAGKCQIPLKFGMDGKNKNTSITPSNSTPNVDCSPLISMNDWAPGYRRNFSAVRNADIKQQPTQQQIIPIQNQGRLDATGMRQQSIQISEFEQRHLTVTNQQQIGNTANVYNQQTRLEFKDQTIFKNDQQLHQLPQNSGLIAAKKNWNYAEGESTIMKSQQQMSGNQWQYSRLPEQNSQLQRQKNMHIQGMLNQQQQQQQQGSSGLSSQNQLNQSQVVSQQPLNRQKSFNMAAQQQQSLQKLKNFTDQLVSSNFDRRNSAVKPPCNNLNNGGPWNGKK